MMWDTLLLLPPCLFFPPFKTNTSHKRLHTIFIFFFKRIRSIFNYFIIRQSISIPKTFWIDSEVENQMPFTYRNYILSNAHKSRFLGTSFASEILIWPLMAAYTILENRVHKKTFYWAGWTCESLILIRVLQ